MIQLLSDGAALMTLAAAHPDLPSVFGGAVAPIPELTSDRTFACRPCLGHSLPSLAIVGGRDHHDPQLRGLPEDQPLHRLHTSRMTIAQRPLN